MLDDELLAGMRDDVAAALPDTCTISRPGPRAMFNPTTLLYDDSDATTVWSGACRVRAQTASERQVMFASAPQVLARYVATLPFDAAGIEVNDYLTVDLADDAALVGHWFRIVEVQVGSWTLGRRLLLEDRSPWTSPSTPAS